MCEELVGFISLKAGEIAKELDAALTNVRAAREQKYMERARRRATEENNRIIARVLIKLGRRQPAKAQDFIEAVRKSYGDAWCYCEPPYQGLEKRILDLKACSPDADILVNVHDYHRILYWAKP